MGDDFQYQGGELVWVDLGRVLCVCACVCMYICVCVD